MVNKIKEKIDDNLPKYRKLDGEQFGQIKKNWCNSEVSQNKDFLIFLILKKKIFYRLFLLVSSKWSIKLRRIVLIIVRRIEN
jgi:hypothetical protein